MSPPDDVLQEYLAECREHLDGIENDMLAIEQAGESADEELVNKVFRAAHSIKGGAGFFDLADIRELAHKTENVLDLIRSKQAVPSADVVGVLLKAFDKLREMIDGPLHADQEGVRDLVGRLEDLVSSRLPGRKKSSVRRQTVIATPERQTRLWATAFDFDRAGHAGKMPYLLEYDLLHNLGPDTVRPLDVVRELMSYGDILDVAVDMQSVGTLEESPSNRLPMDVLYATALGPELIGSILDVRSCRIWQVEAGGACRLLSGCAPWDDAQPSPAAPPICNACSETETASEAPTRPLPTPAVPSSAPRIAASIDPPSASPADATVRMNVSLLDTLMNLAGELVLGRNQLGDAIARGDAAMIHAANQRISIVTTEVQEAVMRTRMQPVGNLFQKYPRLVRDLAIQLGKNVRLVEEGGEVELDKTIVEGLSDPLTHMVRNAVDHGIEAPDERSAAGKTPQGTLCLRAWHEAGLVVVEVSDDGRGLDSARIAAAAVRAGTVSEQDVATMTEEEKLALVFGAGVSTARQVSDISGRGVGLDVVKTNLDRLGGKIEIRSRPREGAVFRIKLPLTLAIIPSLLVQSGEDSMAIPLVNVQELVRIPAAEISHRVDCVANAEVLMLRDGVLPLVHLNRVLDLQSSTAAGEAWNVVVLAGGAYRYGLVVERLHGTVEIVVKPLGRHLKHLAEYAGATILGDGAIALILDVAGLAAVAGLRAEGLAAVTKPAPCATDTHHLLLFRNATEQCAIPLHAVARVLKVQPEQVERIGGRRTMQHRGRSLPLVALVDLAEVEPVPPDGRQVVVVIQDGGREFGVLGTGPVDVIEADAEIDPETLRQPGVLGSMLLRGATTLVLDCVELALAAWPGERRRRSGSVGALNGVRLLVAEDSAFFRHQLIRILETEGAEVLRAADGQAAWDLLENGTPVDLVVTDVEMPRMNGIELTRRIRSRLDTARLPVVMLTSLASEEDVRRGREAGASAYCMKLNQTDLIARIREHCPSTPDVPAGIHELNRLGDSIIAASYPDPAPAETAAQGEQR